ncbi:MAG TPA: glycosyltransferase family 4 protein [Chloroflexota bacterium]
MSSRVLILHYTPPGVIGGVEHVIEQHARLLLDRGFRVEIVAGRQADTDLPVHVIPQIDAAIPENVAIEAELAAGVVSGRFHSAREAILDRLEPLVRDVNALIAHNAFTLHFSLPLTAALWQLTSECSPPIAIAWCHDLAWVNPLYLPIMHDGYPWDLLRVRAPGVTYVTVSHERKEELEDLWDEHEPEAVVVPNGIDLYAFLRLSKRTNQLVRSLDLLDRDAILLLPVRITRRKNIQHAIRAVRVLKDRGLDVRFIVTGPTAPHHPQRSRTYLDELKALRRELDVEAEVIFLADDQGERLDDRTVSELYVLADCLFFPSESEGFGLPILEAGLAGVPAALADIPVFREVGGDEASYFALDGPPEDAADAVTKLLELPTTRLRRRVRQEYRWDVIVDRRLVPLLQSERARLQQPGSKAR